MEEFGLVKDFAIIMMVAGAVTLIFRRLHQPTVLGYLIAGVLIGPYTLPVPPVTDVEQATCGPLAKGKAHISRWPSAHRTAGVNGEAERRGIAPLPRDSRKARLVTLLRTWRRCRPATEHVVHQVYEIRYIYI